MSETTELSGTHSEKLVGRALQRRGYTVINRGWPDFMVIDPKWGGRGSMGRAFAVEVKGPKDQLRPAQVQMHRVLAALGVPVYTVRLEQIEEVANLRGRALLSPTEARGIQSRLQEYEGRLAYELELLREMKAEVQVALQLFDDPTIESLALSNKAQAELCAAADDGRPDKSPNDWGG
jgi:hypothetical protein